MSPGISEDTLREFEQLAVLQEALGNQYEMSLIEKGANKGKVKLSPNRIHGQSDSLDTINGLLMEAQLQRTGQPIFEREKKGLILNRKESEWQQLCYLLALLHTSIRRFTGR